MVDGVQLGCKSEKGPALPGARPLCMPEPIHSTLPALQVLQYDLPAAAIREQISSAINIIVQQTRLPDGSRKIVQVSEITGREKDVVLMQDIFNFVQTGLDEKGKIQGYYAATGNIPAFVEALRVKNDLRLDLGVFVPKV